MRESLIHINKALIPHQQAAKIAKPCKGSFNFPSLARASQFSSILDFGFLPIATVRNDQIDFEQLQPLSQRIAVIPSVGNEPQRPLFRPSPVFSRNTLAVDHYHPLRSFALFGFADACAPFFDGAKLPSIKASSRSSNFFSAIIGKNLRQISNHTPKSSHRRNRRQQVEGVEYRSGRSCQRAPVRSIHKIPSSTSRSSAGGRPPLRSGLRLGNSGSRIFHCSSFMKL